MTATTALPAFVPMGGSTLGRVARVLRTDRLAALGLALIVLVVVLAVFGPWIAPYPAQGYGETNVVDLCKRTPESVIALLTALTGFPPSPPAPTPLPGAPPPPIHDFEAVRSQLARTELGFDDQHAVVADLRARIDDRDEGVGEPFDPGLNDGLESIASQCVGASSTSVAALTGRDSRTQR